MTAGVRRSRPTAGGSSGARVVARRALRCVALAGAAAVAFAAPLAGQQESSEGDAGTADQQTRVPADSVVAEDSAFRYAREVFNYPARGRRNPFAPVDAGVEQGPRFRNLRLRGIIYSPSIGSVAVLLDETTGERYRVRDGQTIGDARVLEIGRSEVTFAVSVVGQTRRETLQVEKREKESQG